MTDFIEGEIGNLLAARSRYRQSDMNGTFDALNALNKTALPDAIAARLPVYGSNPEPFIQDALTYYVSVFRQGYRDTAVPEITEDMIVNALNKYWMRSILFYAAAVVIAAVFGGTALGLVQLNGVSASIDRTQQAADRLQGMIDTKARDFGTQSDKAQTQLDSAITAAQKVVTDQGSEVQKKIEGALTDKVTALKGNLDGAELADADAIKAYADGKKPDIDAALKTQIAAVKPLVAAALQQSAGAEAKGLLDQIQTDKKSADTWAGAIEICYTQHLQQAAEANGNAMQTAGKQKKVVVRARLCD